MKKQKKVKSIYVAVIMRGGVPELVEGITLSMRSKGDWASFVGRDREQVVETARKAAHEWGGDYEILIGQITGVVAFPVHFEVVPL